MKLKEFINESKSPLSLFKKVNPMDKGGKVVKEEKTTYKWDATQKKTLEKLWDKLERAEEYEGAQINRKVVEEAFQEGYEFGRKDAENSSVNNTNFKIGK